MLNVKRNQVFASTMSDSRIRVRAVTKNPVDARRSLVEVVNVAADGKAMKNTARTIFADSIRRWYK